MGRAQRVRRPQLAWDEEVSSLHAQLEMVGLECTLVDDGLSRNGSFVNGERVSGRRRLRDGDTIRFGGTGVIYRAPAARDGDRPVRRRAHRGRRLAGAEARAGRPLPPVQGRLSFATPAPNGQIAEELDLSVDAVKTHLRALFEKFGVEDLPQNQKRVALVERALQSGLVSEREL